MKTLELYRWEHTDPLTGKTIRTRYLLSEDVARLTLINPARLDHTLERRAVPHSPAQWHMTGSFRNAPSSKHPRKPT